MRNFLFLMAVPLILAAQSSKPRVFITDSDSWEVSGGFGAGGSRGTGGGIGSISGGARPQTVEVIKTFRERCGAVTVNLDKAKANYVILFDREGGKDLVSRDNKIAVFKEDGDLVYSGSTRSLGNAVSDACNAIRRDRDK